MDEHGGRSRRSFVKLCASSLALASVSRQLLAQASNDVHHYNKVKLVDKDDQPIRAHRLIVGKNYVFHYPYVSTPCFLLNLGETVPHPSVLQTKNGRHYQWNGGVGPNRSVVAFSAICSHRLTYPAHQVSFINYRQKPTEFIDKHSHTERRAHVIYCCSQRSVYDATRGAEVLGGPAPQPLAAILLDYEEAGDELHAVATQGGELFERFFDKFGFHLALEYRTDDIRRWSAHKATVEPLDQYTHHQVLC